MLPAVAAIAAILILPAHASVIGTTPAAGDVLTEQPGTFSVTMNEQILSVEGADSANAIQVTDASGLYYGDGCFTVDGDTISLDAELGEAGDYALTFQVVSSDGHPVSDTIDFSFEPGAAEAPVCGQAAPGATAEGEAAPGATSEGVEATASADQGQASETEAPAEDAGGSFPFIAIGVLAVLAVLAVIAYRANRLRGTIREQHDEE